MTEGMPPGRHRRRHVLAAQLLLILLALAGGFLLGGGGLVFARGGSGGGTSCIQDQTYQCIGYHKALETYVNVCLGSGQAVSKDVYDGSCTGGNSSGGGGGTSCNPNTIQYCWAQPTCGGDNATNGCGQATHSTGCPSGCGGNTCTPTGGNTIHFVGCDGTCHNGYFDQTNSCGTVTVQKYKSYAASCNTAADGCSPPPPTCTGGQTLVNGTCQCPTGESLVNGTCQAPAPPTCSGGTVVNGTCTCPNGYWDNNGTCQVDCTGGTVTSRNTCACPGGQSDIQGYCCPTGDTVQSGHCTAPTSTGSGGTPPPTCTTPAPGPVSHSGPYITGCASQGEYSTVTYYHQTVWTCPGPTSHTKEWETTGTEATTDCQPFIHIDGTTPLACAAAPDTGSAWSSYTYQNCLSFLGNAVDCGPKLTYTPTPPYGPQGAPFPEPVYNPVACPVPIAVGE
jgi:hypothetical protein